MEGNNMETPTTGSPDAAACLLFEAALSVFTNLLGVPDTGNLLEDAVVASGKLNQLLVTLGQSLQEASLVEVSMDVAHVFAQQLIADGWLNSDLDCVDKLNRQLIAFASVISPPAPALAYPANLTPELGHALGFMNFHTGPVAHVFRAAGYDIARKCEAEQAFVLDRMVRTVITHGKMWRDAFNAQLDAARNKAAANQGRESAGEVIA